MSGVLSSRRRVSPVPPSQSLPCQGGRADNRACLSGEDVRTPRSNNDTHPADALAMLKADHQRIRDLVEHYEATTNPEAQWTIAEEVLGELDVHAQLEEQIFYPELLNEMPQHLMLLQTAL